MQIPYPFYIRRLGLWSHQMTVMKPMVDDMRFDFIYRHFFADDQAIQSGPGYVTHQ